MARYRRRRSYRRRSKQPKSMVVSVMNPLNRLLSQAGLKNRSLRWAATGIASMQLMKVFAEDQYDTVQGYLDDATDWIQDKFSA